MGKTTYHPFKFPFISKYSFKQERIFRSVDAVDTIVAVEQKGHYYHKLDRWKVCKLTQSYKTMAEHVSGPT